MAAKIEKIFLGNPESPKLMDVNNTSPVCIAFYGRVSTDHENQVKSLQNQVESFFFAKAKHGNWKVVDVYADEGVSGTGVKRRKEFQRLIADCEAGKIDYIITKSVSRFARNAEDFLHYIRYLKSINVNVYFEQEGLDTESLASEMLINIMAIYAQEESRSISENLKWGLRKRFEQGIGRWCDTYGYRKVGEKGYEIDPEEAVVVRMIFRMYQHGTSIPEILNWLNAMEVNAARKTLWNKTAVKYLLQNEKYVGDKCLQKWLSTDYLSHSSIPNDSTKVPSYYVKDSHEPIVDRHTFQQVQRIMELKAPHSQYSRYPYCDTQIICPLCGKKLVTRMMQKGRSRKILGCFDVDGCQEYAIRTQILDAALLETYRNLDIDEDCSTEDTDRMRRIKGSIPEMKSVEYYWLDDMVEHIEFENDYAIVTWKGGTKNKAAMKLTPAGYPEHVAALYRNQLIKQGAVRDSAVLETEHMDSRKSCRPNRIPVISEIGICDDQGGIK